MGINNADIYRNGIIQYLSKLNECGALHYFSCSRAVHCYKIF